MNRSHLPVVFALGLLAASMVSAAAAFGQEDSLKSNLTLAQEAVRAAAGEVLTRSGITAGEHVALRVEQGAESWITEQAFAAELKAAGHDVVLGGTVMPADGAVIEIRHPTISVRYTDPSEDGLFGTRRVRRTVAAEFSCMVASAPGANVRMSESLSRALSDTVRVDAVPGIEPAGLNSTRGELPQERFIDRIVEPFVIVGTTGVVVYLLFNIRS